MHTNNVDEKGRETEGDVFYRVKLRSGKSMALAIIVGHKSTDDRHTAFQILLYEATLYRFMSENASDFRDER